LKLRLQAGAHTVGEMARERRRKGTKRGDTHTPTLPQRPVALHTLWHTFERRADDIGMPYGLAFVEHGSNEARIVLAQSVWYSKGESATAHGENGVAVPASCQNKHMEI